MKKNNNKFRRNANLIYIMMALFLAVYIPSIYNLICGKSINVAFITMGEIEKTVSTKGYIIRDETVIKAPFTGRYLKDVDEGERIQANQRIATVLKDGDDEILNAIKKVDFEILEAKRNKVDNKDLFSEDILKLDKQIEKKINLLVEETNDLRYTNYNKIKNDIDRLMYKKNEIIGENATIDTYIETKLIEKEKLKAKLNSNEREVYTKKAGIVSFCVDGFENILNMLCIDKLDCKFFENNRLENLKKDADNLFIRADIPFVKVINGIDAYVVAVLDKENATRYKKDKYVGVRFNDINRLITGQVIKKVHEENGKVLVVVKINKALQYLSSYRVCNIDLISDCYSGYKVPKKSLKNYDKHSKMAQIGIVKSNKVVYKDVKVLGYNRDFAIIENNPLDLEQKINLYDEFILEPENVIEGQIISKM